MPEQVKVLMLAANAYEPRSVLRLDEEIRAIDGAIQRAGRRDDFDLVTALAMRIGDLQAALLRHRPTIVHFAGHGEEAGVRMADETGTVRTVEASALESVFRVFANTIRLVVLNACDTDSTARALAESVEFAIGTDRKIQDRTAILFAEALYGALAAGRPVADAFSLGEARLRTEGVAPLPFRLRTRNGAAGDELLRAEAVPLPEPASPPVQVNIFGDLVAEEDVTFRNGVRTNSSGQPLPGGTQLNRADSVKARNLTFEGS
ncbi:MAG TPA: CHAT domain-containing protein [Longimicrobium sp.]|nr:CHAT domain-containing protein [Longimicrobium sp.]